MKEHEHPYWIKTPKGLTYAKHSSLSNALRHVGDVLVERGIEPTVKKAMEHGFSLEKK